MKRLSDGFGSLESLVPAPQDPCPPSDVVAAILDYLAHHIPGYPFKPGLDRAFVEELVADFSGIDVLDEIKAFRWYYENEPLTRVRNARVALRRWVANARSSPR
jgi:hypothetical protein